ncbi:hypothetical protein BZG20_12820 [Salinivibrio sp. IB868]|nr:hypothetical protein BZG20_12820 [Salinivibrio sp. IB868]OOE77437.1 hypothetical protein BZG22_03020 [Salinivibrio sp. IB870]
MRDDPILLQILSKQCPKIHKKRLISLTLSTKTLLDGANLTLTKLGCALGTQTSVKHTIKRINRLLGNTLLHQEKNLINI